MPHKYDISIYIMFVNRLNATNSIKLSLETRKGWWWTIWIYRDCRRLPVIVRWLKIPTLHYQKKSWNIWKAQWKHSFWQFDLYEIALHHQKQVLLLSHVVLWAKKAICNVRNSKYTIDCVGVYHFFLHFSNFPQLPVYPSLHCESKKFCVHTIIRYLYHSKPSHV